MKYLLIVTLVLGVLTSSKGQSKKAWTLEECVNYALENNLDIKLNNQNVQLADYTKDAGIANLFPDLNFSAGYNWNFGLSVDPVSNLISRTDRQTGMMSLNSNWVIFDGLRNINQLQKAKIDYLAAIYNREAIKNDVTVNVASAYLQVLLNKEVRDVAAEQLNSSRQLAEQMQKRYDAGAVAYGDLLQIQSQMAGDEQRAVAAENNVTLGLLSLAQMLQLQDMTGFDVAEPQAELPGGAILTRSPMEIYQAAEQVQPAVQAADMNEQSAQRSLRMAKAQMYPTLSLQGQINTSYSNQDFITDGNTTLVQTIGYWDDAGNHVPVYTEVSAPTGIEQKPLNLQLEDNVREYIGINLSVPIFSRLQVKNNIRYQEFTLEQARIESERTRNNLLQTIARAHVDAQAALKTYQAATKAVEAAGENLKYARIRLDEGGISQYEYTTANNDYVAALSQQIQSKYDYTFKIQVLEFYLNNKF